MTNKAPSMLLTAFLVTALPLLASDSLALRQGGKAEGDLRSTELAKKAEELLRDALLLSATKDSESTRLRLRECMRLWVQAGKPEMAAQAALQVGDRYKQVRKYQNALYCYKQALDVKLPPGPVSLTALNAVALLYIQLYQSDLALPYLTEALKQARATGDLSAQVAALTSLARFYYEKNDKSQALDLIGRAQKLNRQRNAGADPDLLYLFGQIRQKEGSAEDAKAAFEEALAIYRKQNNAEGQVRILSSISTISLLASQNQEALVQATQAASLARFYYHYKQMVSPEDRLSARELLWRAMLCRARAERAVGQKDKAIPSYELAIAHFEAVWWARYINTEAGALASREEAQAAYRELVETSMERGLIEKAYGYAEQAKARAILTLTAGRHAALSSANINQPSTLRDQTRLIAHKRDESPSSDLGLDRQAQLRKDAGGAERNPQEEQVQSEMANSRERFVWVNLASVEKVQKQMAQEKAGLVEFFLDENRSFVWFFAHGQVFVETIQSRNEIEKAVRSYLKTLAAAPKSLRVENDLTRVREQARALFSTLFGSLAGRIEPGQRLIVVPDGLLHYLPFEALVNKERYLIEDHEISYDPSASMLGLLQNAKNRVEGDDSMDILAIGDPVFDPAGGRKAKADLNVVTRQMRARGFSLPPLPRTLDEVQFITSLFPADRRKLLTGMASTEVAIKQESLRRYRRLHFATHSLIDEKSPLRSAVALTPDSNAEEDGFLEVSEISRLNLDCDLVVVSACQTGRGQLLTGEGIVGLSWAFFRSGARSVVVSLWNVTDISTGQLMKNFYQNMTDGLGNAAALRKAKLQMLNSGKGARHPYYWSAFVIVGKP